MQAFLKGLGGVLTVIGILSMIAGPVMLIVAYFDTSEAAGERFPHGIALFFSGLFYYVIGGVLHGWGQNSFGPRTMAGVYAYNTMILVGAGALILGGAAGALALIIGGVNGGNGTAAGAGVTLAGLWLGLVGPVWRGARDLLE